MSTKKVGVRKKPRTREGTFHPELPKLGDVLRVTRKEHDFTAVELGEKLGYSQSYISGMENGHSQPCVPFLNAFAKFYNINEKQLFLLAGLLPPQYQTYVAAHSEEVHSFLEERVKYHNIPEAPMSIDYTRVPKVKKKIKKKKK